MLLVVFSGREHHDVADALVLPVRMVAVDALIVQILDAGLLAAGAAGFVAWAAHLRRAGHGREPLQGVPVPRVGPAWVMVFGVVVFYVCLCYAAGSLALLGTPAGEVREPGSAAWHRVQLTESGARAAAICLLLAGYQRYAGAVRGGPMSLGAGVAVAGLATVITIALTTPQLQMGRVVWQWLNPGEPLPSHVVLKALRQSAWGGWGMVPLAFSAIVLAPVSEEVLFRGLLLDGLRRDLGRNWPAILFSAVCFAGVHAQPQDILPLVSMGVVLGYLRVRCGHLWPCVLTHLLFNGRTVLLTWLAIE